MWKLGYIKDASASILFIVLFYLISTIKNLTAKRSQILTCLAIAGFIDIYYTMTSAHDTIFGNNTHTYISTSFGIALIFAVFRITQ